MHIATATAPGDSSKQNEDWVFANEHLIVVLDGATARTDTGCRHGIAWYASRLGVAITALATDASRHLSDVLRQAIFDTADQHSECDLTHAATPSAALAILRRTDSSVDYLVLADVTIVLDTSRGVDVITDDRLEKVAREERLAAAHQPFNTEAKRSALLAMKHAELASRNRENGFWVAAADPTVADHAITGRVPTKDLGCLAVLTDGAARAVVLFGLMDWESAMKLMEDQGPGALIKRVRAAEAADPTGESWPRNKPSDDATAVYYRM